MAQIRSSRYKSRPGKNEECRMKVRFAAKVGAIALMFTGLGSIIGSGWLFGAWRAAQLAGPGCDLFLDHRRGDRPCSSLSPMRNSVPCFPESGGAVAPTGTTRTARWSGSSPGGARGGIRHCLGGFRWRPRHRCKLHEFLALGLGAAALCARRQRSR